MRSAQTALVVGPRRVEVRSRPLPELSPGDVLVRAECSGISSGTEMNVYRGTAPQWHAARDATGLFVPSKAPEWRYPFAYGYAVVGTVEEVGGDADGIRPGDRVFAYAPHAERAVVPRFDVLRMPPLEDPSRAVFMANLVTMTNAVLGSRMPLGANVLVTGLGVLGLLLVQLTRRAGAACVVGVDPHEHRRALALRTGADHVLEPSTEVPAAVRDVTGGLGADVVFEASGSPAGLNEAIRSTADNGLVMAVSWYRGPLDGVDLRGEFHHRRIRIESTEYDLPPFLGPAWSLGRLNALAFDILEDLRLDGFVTHRFPFERAAEAYRCVDERQDGLVQCVLEYGAAA